MSKFAVGTRGTATVTVVTGNTAEALGSGSLPVFGTPALLALFEAAAVDAIKCCLSEGETTVGTGDLLASMGKSSRSDTADACLPLALPCCENASCPYADKDADPLKAAQVSHLAPTPVGLEVTAVAEVTDGGDKSCTFKVSATDSSSGKCIGEGTHQRVNFSFGVGIGLGV